MARLQNDLGCCSSCWVIGAVEAISDRICFHSNGTINFRFSSEDLLACCHTCGEGCNGGYSDAAWYYWVTKGIVSGGSYRSEEVCSLFVNHLKSFLIQCFPSKDCQPYSIGACTLHVNDTRGLYNTKIEKTPKYVKKCQASYPVEYKNDKRFDKSSYSISRNQKQIQTEIMTNRPVEGVFIVYADFYNYKNGVYQHVIGKVVGLHAIKILGWGAEKNTPFRLIVNSSDRTL